jgi:hypothetical protein
MRVGEETQAASSDKLSTATVRILLCFSAFRSGGATARARLLWRFTVDSSGNAHVVFGMLDQDHVDNLGV